VGRKRRAPNFREEQRKGYRGCNKKAKGGVRFPKKNILKKKLSSVEVVERLRYGEGQSG